MKTTSYNLVKSQMLKLPPEERVERGRQMRELRDSPAYDLLMQLASDRQADLLQAVTEGIHDHVVYVATHARVQGVGFTGSAIDAVIDSGDEADTQLAQIVREETV